MKKLVEIKDVSKIYNPGENEVRALNHVSLTIGEGEFVAIIGQSGSGKSTLMNMLGCLDTPTSGKYYLHGQDVSHMTDDEQSEVRNREIGFIFQGFNLIPSLTALENVELPLIYRGVGKKERERLANAALNSVGLEKRKTHKPNEMSGGQQQRVAIARALATDPRILYFDEPTSALDPQLTAEVLSVMRELAHEGMTMIVVTHELGFAREVSTHVMFMADGNVVEEGTASEFFEDPKMDRTKEFLRLTEN